MKICSCKIYAEKYKVGININPKNINNLGDVIEKLNSSHFIEESPE